MARYLGFASTRARIAVALIALAAALYVLLRTAWLSDDAYITFRAVENFVRGFGPRWNPDERVQAFTHPLWFLCAAAVRMVSGETYYASYALSIGMSLAAMWVYLGRLAGSAWLSATLAVALLGSQAFVDFSTSGLENPLTNLLVAWFLLIWFRGPDGSAQGRILRLSVAAGLIMTNRIDAGLLVLPALLVEVAHLGIRRTIRWAAVGMVPFAAWELCAVTYFGFPFPNTVYAKLPPNVSVVELVPQGLAYLLDSWTNDPITLVVIGATVVMSCLHDRRRLGPLAAGLGLAVASTVLVGGDFMSGRFLACPFFLAVGMGAGSLEFRRVEAKLAVSAAVVALVLISRVVPVLGATASNRPLVSPAGIADERRAYYQVSGLFRENRSRGQAGLDTSWPHQIQRALARGKRVASMTMVGAAGYFAGRDLHIVDQLALGDPLLSRLPAEPGWRVGHYFRTLPPGYLQALREHRNLIEDPGVAAFYDKIQLVTRGGIWSRKRWVAILDINLHRADYLLDGYTRGYVGVSAAAALGPRPDTTRTGEAAAIEFSRGLVLWLDRPRGMRVVEFSLDLTAGCRIEYRLRGVVRYSELANVAGPGFITYRQTLPATIGGVDEVRLIPVNQSALARLAYWRMIE